MHNEQDTVKGKVLRNRIKNLINQNAYNYVNQVCLNLNTKPQEMLVVVENKNKENFSPKNTEMH